MACALNTSDHERASARRRGGLAVLELQRPGGGIHQQRGADLDHDAAEVLERRRFGHDPAAKKANPLLLWQKVMVSAGTIGHRPDVRASESRNESLPRHLYRRELLKSNFYFIWKSI
jgi:hypothetical protein